MEGIRYIKDENGKNVAVQINLEENSVLWNEFLKFIQEKKDIKDNEKTPEEEEQMQEIRKKLDILSKQSKLSQVINELDSLSKE